MDIREIGRIILFHRKISGLSRIQCAMMAGVGKTVIYDIEHGKESVQLNTLMKILHVLNIQITLTSPLMKHYDHENS
ncbi:MAG: helix-turn-helix domain-containing protein [Bacteroidota bacterium]